MNRILILSTLLILAVVSPARDEENQFIAAVLRADGTLLPFAQYTNGGWTNPWPRPRQNAESIYAEDTEVIPHSLGDLPEPWFKQCGKIPKRWYVWSTLATPLVLNAAKVVKVENHSQTNWALSTNFPNPIANDGHHDNLGITLNVNKRVEPLLQIQPDTAEAVDVTSFVRQAFEKAETAELKHLYRSMLRLNGEYLYYFEAHQKHATSANSTDRDCYDISIFQGWMTADVRGGMGLRDSRTFFTNCDMKGPSSTTPLGLLHLNNTIFLFVSEHGWEDESYLILELDNSGLHKVLETYGG